MSAFDALLTMLNNTPEGERQPLVDAFVDAHELPFVTDERATFVLLDGTATSVQVAGDHTGWAAAPVALVRVPGTTLWHASAAFAADARVDYKFIVDGAWILDPRNPNRVPSGFGDNSELRMPAWVFPSAITFDGAVPHGTVSGVLVNAASNYPPETLHSDVLGNDRDVRIYLPPGYDPAIAYPLLVVNDGGDYVRLAHMPTVLDNLLAAGSITPLVVAFVSPVDREAEYVGASVPGYVSLIEDELLPFVATRASLSGDGTRRAVMGTSYGGFISMRIARDLSGTFGMFAAQSGILLYDDGAVLDDIDAASALKVWLDVGLIGDATEDSRAARDAFVERGVEHAYLEVNEGHSWGSWRARLDDILVFLFPA